MPPTLSVSALNTEIEGSLPTNHLKLLQASNLRPVLHDIVNNFQVTIDGILATGTANSTTYLAGDGTWKSYVSAGGSTRRYLVNDATVTGGDFCYCDTSGGAFNITLPSSPSTGMGMSFRDVAGTWDTQHLTIIPSSQKIESATGNLVCETKDANFDIVWEGGTVGWVLVFTLGNFRRA